MKNSFSYIFLFLLLSCTSSTPKNNPQNTSFSSEKWKEKSGDDFPNRKNMLDDLVKSKLLKTIKRDSILNLLGTPSKVDSNYLFYKVSEEKWGFFTLHTTSLVIKFNADSTVNWVKIHK